MTTSENVTFGNVREVRNHILTKLKLLWVKYEKTPSKKVWDFIGLLDDLFNMDYFEKYPNATVGVLVEWIKKDRNDLLKYIEQKEKEIAKKEIELEREKNRELQPWESDPYIIPDEEYEYAQSKKDSMRRIQDEIGELQSCIQEYRRQADQLHKLLGIIKRPNGFFKSVLN